MDATTVTVLSRTSGMYSRSRVSSLFNQGPKWTRATSYNNKVAMVSPDVCVVE